MEGSYDECNEATSFYELTRSTADNKKTVFPELILLFYIWNSFMFYFSFDLLVGAYVSYIMLDGVLKCSKGWYSSTPVSFPKVIFQKRSLEFSYRLFITKILLFYYCHMLISLFQESNKDRTFSQFCCCRWHMMVNEKLVKNLLKKHDMEKRIGNPKSWGYLIAKVSFRQPSCYIKYISQIIFLFSLE